MRETTDGVRVVFEAGALDRVGEIVDAARVLVIGSSRRPEWVARARGSLDRGGIGRCVAVVDDVLEHVPVEAAERARRIAKETRATALLAIGGGSAIGLAKAVALTERIPIAAVATTYSGSEMTPIHGVTTASGKETGRSEDVRPRVVIYDVSLTMDIPLSLSMESALNAMAHAAEAMYAPSVSQDRGARAEEAIRSLASGMRQLRAHPSSQQARIELLCGAHLAGMCLAEAAMGLHHKLAHVLGGGWNLPHAATHAALLPHVLRYNAAAAPLAMDRIARALGVADAPLGVHRLALEVGAPTALDPRFTERDVTEAAQRAASSPYPNPAALDVERVAALLRAARTGDPPPSSLPLAYRGGDTLGYLAGFGAHHQSEARPNALPRDQNSPRRPPYGLHAEQINGTGFTARRQHNRRTWMYRVRPSVLQSDFAPYEGNPRFVGRFEEGVADPNLGRWRPLAIPPADRRVDFVDGMTTFGGAGDPDLRQGLAVHLYAANASMDRRAFYDADGDLLIVPELGGLRVCTELGLLDVFPGQVLILPRGLKMSVGLTAGVARGYVLEVYGGGFQLPERGPIGANGLSDERHFEAPVACFDAQPTSCELLTKSGGRLYAATLEASPFDVVAWHGSHVPYRYDLSRYNSMGTVSFDHPDPSILTVLTVPFDDRGQNLSDFVIFPGRWDVAEHSLRPPYFHRNVACEFNGIVSMDAPGRGFEPGCYFFTPSLTAHGVAASSIRHQVAQPDDVADRPVRGSKRSLWVMFESILALRVMPWHLEGSNRDAGYRRLFDDLPIEVRDRSG